MGDAVVGGLLAYVLDKPEREGSEIYVYDLAVALEHRRQGIATRLLKWLRERAKSFGAWVIFIQADADDPVPIALYESLGQGERVLHFDITVGTDDSTGKGR